MLNVPRAPAAATLADNPKRVLSGRKQIALMKK
jgi:hypothetical protein